MTVSSTTSKNTYAGDGSTTVFAYTFRILANTHILVQLKNSAGTITTKTLTTDYTVSGVDSASGGNITFVTAPASTDTVILSRDVPIKQETDYTENDTFPAESHESALDELTMICQQIDEATDRTVKVDIAVTGFNATLPTPSADKYIKFNDAGTAFEYITLASTAGITAVVDDPSPQLGGALDCNAFSIQLDSGTGIQDENGNEQIKFTTTASAVNEFTITNAATGSDPTISVTGGDTNIGMSFQVKGTGDYAFKGTATAAASLALYEDTDNGTNYVALSAPTSITTNLTLTLPSADASVASTPLVSSAAGVLSFSTGPHLASIVDTGGNEQVTFTTTASAVNQVSVTNAATGNAPTIAAAGDDTNIALKLAGKGTGNIQLYGTDISHSGDTVLVGRGAATASELRLYEYTGNGSNYIGLKAPTSCATRTYEITQALISGWVTVAVSGGTTSISDSSNVSSVTDDGTGAITVYWDIDFANTNYSIISQYLSTSTYTTKVNSAPSVGQVTLHCFSVDTPTLQDPDAWYVMSIGDQS